MGGPHLTEQGNSAGVLLVSDLAQLKAIRPESLGLGRAVNGEDGLLKLMRATGLCKHSYRIVHENASAAGVHITFMDDAYTEALKTGMAQNPISPTAEMAIRARDWSPDAKLAVRQFISVSQFSIQGSRQWNDLVAVLLSGSIIAGEYGREYPPEAFGSLTAVDTKIVKAPEDLVTALDAVWMATRGSNQGNSVPPYTRQILNGSIGSLGQLLIRTAYGNYSSGVDLPSLWRQQGLTPVYVGTTTESALVRLREEYRANEAK